MFRWISSVILFRQRRSSNSLWEFCTAVKSEKPLCINPFYEKYADKIATFQKMSPEKSKELLEKIKSKSLTKDGSGYMKNSIFGKPLNSAVNQKHEVRYVTGQKMLDQIMKLELLTDRSPDDIESIWRNYLKEKDCLYSVLPGDAYDEMYSRFLDYPTFLFPLPRTQGYEFIMCQFLAHSCYFTSLINYQTFKDNAPTCLIVTYYPELKEKKGIILMQGEFDEQSLKVHEAQFLTNQLQLYYSGKDKKKEQLLWHFTKQPEMFKHMDLVSELEYL